MAEENQIEVKIVLDDGSIQTGFIKMEQKAKEAEKGLISAFSPFLGVAASAVAGIATAVGVLEKSSHAASEAESSTTKFNLALANAGKYSKEASDSFSEYAKNLEGITGIDDDLIKSNASLLISIGKLSGEGLEKATQASLDLSKGIGIDTSSAFELLSKAASGSAGALARYGIKIDETLPKSEQFNSALAKIEQRFGGLAVASGGTFEGQLTKIGTAFNNIFEEIGNFIVKSPAIKATFGFIADGFNKIADLIASKGSVSFVDNLILRFADFALFLADNVVPVIEFLVRSFITGFRTIQFLVDEFVSGVAQSLKFILTPIAAFNDDVKKFLDTFAESTADVANDSFNNLSSAAEKTFNTDISTSIQTFVAGYKDKMAEAIATNKDFTDSLKNSAVDSSVQALTIGESFSALTSGFKAQSLDLATKSKESFAQVGRSMFNGVGQAAGQAFSAFGSALAKGENGLAAFLQSFAKSFGLMAVQMGTQFILMGTAYAFSGIPKLEVQAGPLIAAGAALATFGGIISALTGGGGAPTGASGASGGGVGSGVSAPATGSPIGNVAAVENKPQSKIEVNIAGSVLDSHETGLRIVDLLNSAFDQNGVVVTGRAI